MLSMVHTAALASVATPMALESEVFTALVSKVPLVTSDPALSDLWALEVQAYPAVPVVPAE